MPFDLMSDCFRYLVKFFSVVVLVLAFVAVVLAVVV